MTYTFIVNPTAGRGRFRHRITALQTAALASGMDGRFVYTRHRGHAAELAASVASSSDVVVAVGGDGTIHEVVSGLIAADSKALLGVVPAGTGNDFAKMFDLPSNLGRLVDVFRTTKPGRIDYGRLDWEGPGGRGSTLFVNVAGVGIDAKVAAAAAGIKRLRGTLRYLAAVLRTLPSWEAPSMRVDLYEDGRRVDRIEDEVLLALVGNGRCAAGGFYITPTASIVDGRLDACIVRVACVRRILSLIPRVLKGRDLADEPGVTLRSVDVMEVVSSVPLALQADGEVLTAGATFARFGIVPGGLRVVMPVIS